jgi:Ni,Fe-hydrogenase III small subunit/formate hydrogenlyase subunit 6/NADH:ubiquinone oxidoreductase subunit I
MFSILRERLRQGHRTIAYPAGDPPPLPDRFRGLPVLDASKCPDGCKACSEACPTDAIGHDDQGLRLDMGRCLFCTDCLDACPADAIHYTRDYRLAVRTRDDLIVRSGRDLALARPLDPAMLRLFGRSLKLRQVCAGGDSAAEADLNVLGTVVFDLGRFGIQFVASPRHADGLVVTGPVTDNMKFALLETYKALPPPKLVIAVGVDAISGGIFRDHPEVHNGLEGLLPIDLYIPGNPPHPLTILDGFLRLLDRLQRKEPRPGSETTSPSVNPPMASGS